MNRFERAFLTTAPAPTFCTRSSRNNKHWSLVVAAFVPVLREFVLTQRNINELSVSLDIKLQPLHRDIHRPLFGFGRTSKMDPTSEAERNCTVPTNDCGADMLSIMETASAITDTVAAAETPVAGIGEPVVEVAEPLGEVKSSEASGSERQNDIADSASTADAASKPEGPEAPENKDKRARSVRYLPPTKKDDAALTFPEK
jgi:hypothetical protein